MKTKNTVLTGKEKGSVMHKLMELVINKKTGAIKTEDDKYKATKEFKQIEDKLDKAMTRQANSAAQQVLDIYEEYKKNDPNAFIRTESRVHWLGGSGIADVYIISGNIAHIIDLKTGGSYSYYEPSNRQFLQYAAGIVRYYEEVEKIHITVIDGVNEKLGKYDREGIEIWEQRKHEKRQDFIKAGMTNEFALDALVALEALVESGEVDTEALYVAYLLPKFKNKLVNEAQRQVEEEGAEFKGYENKPTRKLYIDEEGLKDYAKELGKEDELINAFKPNKERLKNVFTAEERDEIDRREIWQQIDSPTKNTFKKIK